MRMLRVLSLLLPLLIAWPAVSHAETAEHKLIHDGKERTYLLTVPSAPAAAAHNGVEAAVEAIRIGDEKALALGDLGKAREAC